MARLPSSTPTFLLTARQKWHNDERNARQDDSGNAVLRGVFLDDVGHGFKRDIRSEDEKTTSDNSQAETFFTFTTLSISVSGHSPEERSSGNDFNEASVPKPTREILPAIAPAMTATSPSRVFHPIVKYSSRFPRRATCWRIASSIAPRIAPVQQGLQRVLWRIWALSGCLTVA